MRLTAKIKRPDKEDLIVYTKGTYEDTIPAEMTKNDIRAILKKLAAYEDAEEQGLLLRLPCGIGDTLYTIYTCEDVEEVLDGSLYGVDGGPGTATGYYCPYELDGKCPHKEAGDCRKVRKKKAVFEDTADYIGVGKVDFIIGLKYTNECMNPHEIGRTVFYTREEAEAKLKEMEGGHGE